MARPYRQGFSRQVYAGVFRIYFLSRRLSDNLECGRRCDGQTGACGIQIQPLFITVDPKRDTPAVVKQYAAAFGPKIEGLTGTPEEIAEVAKEYRVYYAEHRTGTGQTTTRWTTAPCFTLWARMAIFSRPYGRTIRRGDRRQSEEVDGLKRRPRADWSRSANRGSANNVNPLGIHRPTAHSALPVPGTRRGRERAIPAAEGATGPRKRSGTQDRDGQGSLESRSRASEGSAPTE